MDGIQELDLIRKECYVSLHSPLGVVEGISVHGYQLLQFSFLFLLEPKTLLQLILKCSGECEK
jgi:hypothetical protein